MDCHATLRVARNDGWWVISNREIASQKTRNDDKWAFLFLLRRGLRYELRRDSCRKMLVFGYNGEFKAIKRDAVRLQGVKILVPATSANLGPGFDSLGVALGLHNTCEIHRSRIASIQISGEGEKNLKLKTDNIFTRIFKETYTHFGGDVDDSFRFSFSNLIPISRGLGSSSAVVIGAVFGAFCFLGRTLDAAEILKWALRYERHPDNITPALVGGFCAAMVDVVRGANLNVENLNAVNLNKIPNSENPNTNPNAQNPSRIPNHTQTSTQNNTQSTKPTRKVSFMRQKVSGDIKAVVVIPNRPMSTKMSRDALPKQLSLHDASFNIAHSNLVTAAFMSGNYALLREATSDKLHQVHRMKTYPVLFAIFKNAVELGAISSTLSGSGSTMLNICWSDDASRIAEILSQNFPGFAVKILNFDNDGTFVAEHSQS